MFKLQSFFKILTDAHLKYEKVLPVGKYASHPWTDSYKEYLSPTGTKNEKYAVKSLLVINVLKLSLAVLTNVSRVERPAV